MDAHQNISSNNQPMAGQESDNLPPAKLPNGVGVRTPERLLVVVPESHLDRKESQAFELASSIASLKPEARVMVFLEAQRHENSDKNAVKNGIPFVGVGTGICNEIYFPLAFATVAADFCRVAAVNGDPRHPRTAEIMEEAEKGALIFAALHDKEVKTIDIMAIQNYLLHELGFAAGNVRDRLGCNPPEFMQALDEMPDKVSGKFPPALRAMMLKVLDSVPADAVASYNSFQVEIERVMDVRLPRFNYTDYLKLKGKIWADDAISSYDRAQELFKGVRVTRNYAMPYFIMQNQFEIGIFNCGLNHAISNDLIFALAKAGIKVVVDPSAMLGKSS